MDSDVKNMLPLRRKAMVCIFTAHLKNWRTLLLCSLIFSTAVFLVMGAPSTYVFVGGAGAYLAFQTFRLIYCRIGVLCI